MACLFFFLLGVGRYFVEVQFSTFPPGIICVLFKPIHDHRNFLLLFFLKGSFFSFLHLDFMIHQIFLYGWLRELTTKISTQLSGTLHFTLDKKFYPDF